MCIYAALSPFAIAHMGYTAEEMKTCRQILSRLSGSRTPELNVDWPRNGLTEVVVQCPFIALGRAVGGGDPAREEQVLAMQPVLATATIVTIVFVWASRLAGNRRRGFWIALAAGYCTMLWPYAYIGLETTQSLFLLMAAYLALGTSENPSWKRAVVFALCAAIAISAKSGGLALVPVVAYLSWTAFRRTLVKLAVGVAIIAAVFAVNHHYRTISWERFGGTSYWAEAWRSHDVISSLMGTLALLVSPTKGLIVFAPLALLGLVLLPRTFRRNRPIALFALLTLAGLLALLFWIRPWADETWGPRYIHSAVAPLLICLAAALRGRRFSSIFRLGLLTAAAMGFAVSLLGSMFYYGALGAVAMQTTPLTLQAVQGDPTWNHVGFNAKLLKTWLESKRGPSSHSSFVPRPDPWDYSEPIRQVPWTNVDLRPYAIPQPVLLRSPQPGDPLRPIFNLCWLLAILGVPLVVLAGRAAALTDERPSERSPEPSSGPVTVVPIVESGPVTAASPPPTPAQAFDGLVAGLGFDPAAPGWFPALRELHRHSRTKHLQLIPDFFYTPVFAPADLPASVWEGRFDVCGEWDLEKQKQFLKGTPAFREDLAALTFAPNEDESVYHWGNDQFSHADAALYHAMIRRFRPKRVVEVGSGHSTKLAVKALRENGTGTLLCIDPHAPAWLRKLDGPIEIRQEVVQAAKDSVFLDLEPSDILFIDGSHISKTGSDVNHLFLRILPRLPAGVVVHIHDICLPYEYARNWSEDVLCYWNEQYVLAALLANSEKYEILVGVYFVQRNDYEALKPFVPDIPGIFPGGGSLWMRVRS
jgi:hypothetical protein